MGPWSHQFTPGVGRRTSLLSGTSRASLGRTPPAAWRGRPWPMASVVGGDHVLDLTSTPGKNLVNDGLHPPSGSMYQHPLYHQQPTKIETDARHPSGYPTKARRQEAARPPRSRPRSAPSTCRFRRDHRLRLHAATSSTSGGPARPSSSGSRSFAPDARSKAITAGAGASAGRGARSSNRSVDFGSVGPNAAGATHGRLAAPMRAEPRLGSLRPGSTAPERRRHEVAVRRPASRSRPAPHALRLPAGRRERHTPTKSGPAWSARGAPAIQAASRRGRRVRSLPRRDPARSRLRSRPPRTVAAVQAGRPARRAKPLEGRDHWSSRRPSAGPTCPQPARIAAGLLGRIRRAASAVRRPARAVAGSTPARGRNHRRVRWHLARHHRAPRSRWGRWCAVLAGVHQFLARRRLPDDPSAPPAPRLRPGGRDETTGTFGGEFWPSGRRRGYHLVPASRTPPPGGRLLVVRTARVTIGSSAA